MQIISSQIESFQKSSSWIRKMFEAGIELKKKYGADNVCDFSLGNPDLVPPASIVDALRALPEQVNCPAGMGYMPNAGYADVRAGLANYLSKEQGVTFKAENLVITCGAAGGLNCLFRAILTPGEEVLCPAPYFVEYGFYTSNFGGVLKSVPSIPENGFHLDLQAFEAAITEKTRAVIINNPNNPSGVIYTADELQALGKILDKATAKYGRPILLISDEPYRFLAFDGAVVPPVMPLYTYTVIVGSFSKNLALAGERVGYIAVNPAMPEGSALVAGVTMTNRILGFVNAPCLGQRLMLAALGTQADPSAYISRRKKMAAVLTAANIEFTMPAGTFYFFPKAPNGMNDIDFVNKLAEERILVVPGSGFGFPGYFRIALCVDEKFIDLSAEGFKRAAKA
ncbi:MAG: pyridoxal phosphate-dependent aminotransferase [Victivallales bacterium]|nr:pyridoxal phosphate-dependent aminotransferase [Victivallales bacterium]